LDPNKPDVMLSQVAEYLRPDRDRGTIGYEQVPVPADIGVVLSYRESTRLGALAAKARITDLAARCPGSRFAIAGYSQGAAIAGDVLADIGQGRGPIPADRVSAGVLFADPRRTANDQLVGPHVPGI